MVELEGDELDANLHNLRKKAHAKALEVFPKYAQIVMKKPAFEWKKAEKNRALAKSIGISSSSNHPQVGTSDVPLVEIRQAPVSY